MSTTTSRIATWAEKLPTSVTPTVHRLAIASLASQIGIIVTGGAVRLTKSGLGCSQWPNCVPGSMTPVPASGIHGLIEFGNRMLTFVLVVIAIAMIASLWNMRRKHPVPFRLSIVLLGVIPIQAIIGGITVWTRLNPWVVSLHFLASAALVAAAALLVNRTGMLLRGGTTPAALPVTPTQSALGWLIMATASASVILGTIVTGTGPHAGANSNDGLPAPRHDFDAYLVTRVHVVPVYLLVAATVFALAYAITKGAPKELRTGLWLLAGVVLLQGAIGYTQHFTGLPIGLVLAHMLCSALLVAAAFNVWDRSTGRFPA
ncbi:COX15/CtaA family protein [Paeniglutamicibacter cryotolerans]|uniref:Cytochrome c oxidase assembly protein subunit 15 n=1 Tax=Paeniglutamicibacter cryotolerans TaxID=670079 RepID=A0A839QQH3_9MICC|nr:COX15/CtaA family protein [Paeniglutamicibacter cryotolerans]MBB2996885.1 cytochrome c oxidase assembly protein subunit 15 [Paeniglutamicibacter cryotolerans]